VRSASHRFLLLSGQPQQRECPSSRLCPNESDGKRQVHRSGRRHRKYSRARAARIGPVRTTMDFHGKRIHDIRERIAFHHQLPPMLKFNATLPTIASNKAARSVAENSPWPVGDRKTGENPTEVKAHVQERTQGHSFRAPNCQESQSPEPKTCIFFLFVKQ